MKKAKRTGRPQSSEASPKTQATPTKKRRSELEMLSADTAAIQDSDLSPMRPRHGPQTSALDSESPRRSNPGELSHSAIRIIREKDEEISRLRQEKEVLEKELEDMRVKFRVPSQSSLLQRRPSGSDEIKKPRKPSRTLSDRGRIELKMPEAYMTVPEYSIYRRIVDPSDFDEPKGYVEVPSWRISVVAQQKALRKDLDEVTNDDNYLKRHLKLEIEERRRKKWDRQWMSEQKRFERARRKQSQAIPQGQQQQQQQQQQQPLSQKTASKVPVLSLFPSGTRLQGIEITENVPVVAWGCSIPVFKFKEFSCD